MEATVRQLLGNREPQKPHVARGPVVSIASKPPHQTRHAYHPATVENGLLAAETTVAYGHSIPDGILAAMLPGKEYSRVDILTTTGIREADWSWAIRQLKEQGLVTQAGEKRGARYRKG